MSIETAPHNTALRHALFVRICHWVNVLSMLFLLLSGIAIFFGHAALYWGQVGYFGHESAWLTVLDKPVPLVSLIGRNFHFLFAWVFVINGLLYLLPGLLNGHFFHKLLPSRKQLQPAYIIKDIVNHFKLKAHNSETETQYNLLQKLAYLVVIFVLCPMMLATGLSMSPGFVAVYPELLDFFGGRQSGRSIHFICACLLLLFVAVHVFQVIVIGAKESINAMITGR